MPSPASEAPAILLLSRDLLIGSQVLGLARSLGVAARQVQSTDDLRAALAEPPRRVLVDLSTPGLDMAALVALVRATEPPPAIIAFGPHVHAGLLAAARDAGCDEVLTRGQFTAQLARVLQG